MGCIFLISGSFYLIDVAFSAPALGVDIAVLWAPKLFHLAATILAGTIWLVLRPPRSMAFLNRLDAGATIVLSTAYGLMAVAGLDADRLAPLMNLEPWRATTDPLMACSYVVVVRALIVPSRPGRTVWISLLAMLPIVMIGPYVLERATGELEVRFATMDLAMWSGAAIVVSAIASRVIYGLRAEVAKIRRLGQYTLEEKIGEGGMGIVYRASPAMLRRPTAIKLLRPDQLGGEGLQRFEREVQLTASLTHPNTVAIFDYGRTPDGIFYYAMEYLDGINLQRLVTDDGPQPPGRVIHLLVQVCGSLAEAHGVGLIHRDIKPGNILLVERGGVPDVVKVVDFGLAKRIGPADTAVTEFVTTTSAIQGTPLYMPARGPSQRGDAGRPQRSLRPRCRGVLPADRCAGVPGRHGRRGVRASPQHRAPAAVETRAASCARRSRRHDPTLPGQGSGRPSRGRPHAAAGTEPVSLRPAVDHGAGRGVVEGLPSAARRRGARRHWQAGSERRRYRGGA